MSSDVSALLFVWGVVVLVGVVCVYAETKK